MVFDRLFGRKNKEKERDSITELPVGSINIPKNKHYNIEIHSDNSGKIMGHFYNDWFKESAQKTVIKKLFEEGNIIGDEKDLFTKDKKSTLKFNKLDNFDFDGLSFVDIEPEYDLDVAIAGYAAKRAENTGRPCIVEYVPRESHESYKLAVANGFFRRKVDELKEKDKMDNFVKLANFGSSEYYDVLLEPKSRSLVIPTLRIEDGDYTINKNGLDDILTIPNKIPLTEKDKNLETAVRVSK